MSNKDESRDQPAPVFEKEVHPLSPAGEVQGMANIAGAFRDDRDPVRRRYARIMIWTILGVPMVSVLIMAVAGVISG